MKVKTSFGEKVLSFFLFVMVLSLAFLIEKNIFFIKVSKDEDIIEGEESQSEVFEVRLLFGGDLMFDRHIRLNAQKHGNYDFIFSNLKELFFGYDLVVANLEGPITNNLSVSSGTIPGSPKNFIFTFDPRITQVLADHNIRVVCLGNNHILNFGQKGLAATKQYLDQDGVGFFGFTGDETGRVLVKEINNIRLGFVNYNQFLAGGLAAVEEDINNLSDQVDWLILYAHWGDEYQEYFGEEIKDLAHYFVDQGVDLVIGSHPHVVWPHEKYQGKNIYYSLGNFVFDQYFSPETTKGILVEVVISGKEGEIITKEWPIEMKPGGQTNPSSSEAVF